MPSDPRRDSSAGSARSAGAYNAGGGRPRDVGQQGDPAAFVNAFWGPNDAGFAAMQARMRTAQKTMDDLRALYKERAEIEAEYAKRLAKLSKSSTLGTNESGAFRAALETVRFELDATSRSHASLSNMLRKELDGQVADFQSKFIGARKTTAPQIEKLYKQKQTQETYVNKSREKYEQDCIKINGYTAQSSLVQGRDLDKVSAKLDKAQATVGVNEKDYQNFIKALKDTTIKWNGEWKVYLDQCQDLEEERLEFIKANMWNYANGVSAICVADDESCERVRVALENCDTLRDLHFFIQKEATGSLIPDAPEYINYARGQPAPSRPTAKQASFTRTSERPMPIFASVVAAVAPVLPPSAQAPTQVAATTAPLAPHSMQQQVPRGRSPPPSGSGDAGVTLTDPGPQSFRPPPGAVGLPGMTKPAVPSGSAPERRLSRHDFISRAPSLSLQMSASAASQNNGTHDASAPAPAPASAASADVDDDPIAKALANLRAMQDHRAGHTGASPSLASVSLGGPSHSGPGHLAHPQYQRPVEPEAPQQPTPEELAAQRENERAAATVASLPAKYQPPLLSSPYAPNPGAPSSQGNDTHRRAPSPSPSTRSHASQQRPKSPSAVFMGAPPRSPSPLPQAKPEHAASGGMTSSTSIEDIVGTYGQAFPGERKALSRQHSTASRTPSHAGSASYGGSRPVSGQMQGSSAAGMAGVGARGRSPSPGPPITGLGAQGRPSVGPGSHHYAGSQSSHAARVASTATVTGAPGAVPPRSTTPLGIMLNASGAVTHDQMADEYVRRASSTAPGSQRPTQAQPPAGQGYPNNAPIAPPQIQTHPGAQSHPHYQTGHPPASPYGQPAQQQPPVQKEGGYAQVPPQGQYPYQGAPHQGPQSGYSHQPPQSSAASQYGHPATAHVQHATQPSAYGSMHSAQPSYATQHSAYSHPAHQQQQQPPPHLQHLPPQSHTPAPQQQQQHHQHHAPPSQHAAYASSQSVYAGHQPLSAGGVAPSSMGGGPAPYGAGAATGPSVSQSVPAHLAGGNGGPGQALGAAGPSPAAEYMQQYLQQQQTHTQQQRSHSPAPPPSQYGAAPHHGGGATAVPPATPVPPSAPAAGAPTGQYSDAGHPILFYVKALYDYSATQASEFSFTAGDIIAVTHTAADGWWSGEILDEARRRPGANTFPSNFVSLLS
ncbi:hypothetical protein V8E36_008717 [Tilletia maclaganii]